MDRGSDVSPAFEPAPAAPVLAPGEVHLWRARLDPAPGVLAELAAVSSAAELARARRMRFPHLADAAIASAGILRRILALYAAAEPSELSFVRGPEGKPALPESSGRPAPRFNLSHSGKLALVAVHADREVGVDVEEVVPGRVDEPLAERVLGERELELWRSVPAARRAPLFFEVWTHKEAVMKAAGKGLSIDPASIEVLLEDAEGAPSLATRIACPDGRFALQRLDPGTGYAGALALEGELGAVRAWTWPLDSGA